MYFKKMVVVGLLIVVALLLSGCVSARTVQIERAEQLAFASKQGQKSVVNAIDIADLKCPAGTVEVVRSQSVTSRALSQLIDSPLIRGFGGGGNFNARRNILPPQRFSTYRSNTNGEARLICE